MALSYGEQLRAARQALGLTQRATGDRVGVSIVHISEIERGTRAPSDALAARIEGEFGLRFDRTPEIARLRRIADAARAIFRYPCPNQPEYDALVLAIWGEASEALDMPTFAAGKRVVVCPRCEGSGRDPGDYLPEPCGDCGGSGKRGR